MLSPFYQNDERVIEIGTDEAGRGPLMGRVYSAAVILPRNDEFKYSLLKDSKRFHSQKRITEVSDYIKQHAVGYGIAYRDERVIDKVNILQATQLAMKDAINQAIHMTGMNPHTTDMLVVVDGNYFIPEPTFNVVTNKFADKYKHVCIEKGDNKYCAIAAASILAKVARDQYIHELCDEHPKLDEQYGLRQNKGYGTAQHINGIRTHGLSPFHRQSFKLKCL